MAFGKLTNNELSFAAAYYVLESICIECHSMDVIMAKKLGITQDGVSRLEQRSDLLLSTLRKTVEAMGGNLSLVAEFPDRAPVVLTGIAEDF